MASKIKIGLYVFFLACMIGFAFRFQAASKNLGESRMTVPEDPKAVDPAVHEARQGPENKLLQLLPIGLGFLVSSAGFAILLARDLSHYFGMRFTKFLHDEPEQENDSEYEEAEQEWANGNYLEAIQLLRDYLKRNPRGQHAAIRIAEIYEEYLHNYLAAALEYEEVLKHNLPPERWGWCAIHLCNLYSKRLDQPDKAVALLKRICREYGQTSAAAKARERLSQIGELPEDVQVREAGSGGGAEVSGDTGSAEGSDRSGNLPPGFSPKK